MKKDKDRRRRSVNLVSGVLSFLFVVLAAQLSDGKAGQFATKINQITRNLNLVVASLNVNVNYTDFVNNANYSSSTQFNSKGMKGLYNLTDLFINVIAPDDILMDDLIKIDNNNQISIQTIDGNAIAKYYASLVAVVVFLVVCTMLFPICGVCFCCCRCCGNCGAKPLPSDKKKDTSRKVILAVLLILCSTGLLFCIVCAFGSNQQLKDGLDELPDNLQTSLDDTKTYMDTTIQEINHLLKDNYQEFTDVLLNLIDSGSEIAMDHLKDFTNASAVSTIYEFVNSLEAVNATLRSMKDDTNALRVYASQLNDALRKVKRDLTTTLQTCSELGVVPECKTLKAKIDQLQTNIDFNQVPDVSETINSLNKLNLEQIKVNIEEGISKLDKIENEIKTHLTEGLSEAKVKIGEAGELISENLDSITSAVNDVKTQIDSAAEPVLDSMRSAIDVNGERRYYVGVTVSCVLLLVTVCIVFGLICGVCGKRPDGYSDNCCNKGTGSSFLLCAVVIMFLFGFILSLFTIASLLVGVISEKVICDPLRNPDPTKYNIIKLLDDYNLDLGVQVTPSEVLSNCHKNYSIYETFNLKTKFDLDEITEKYDISDALSKLDFSGISIPTDLVLVSNETFDLLRQFSPNINVDAFIDELSSNLTNYNLSELAGSLQSIIATLSNTGSQESLKSDLQLSLLHLNTYEEKLIKPMKEVSTDLTEKAQNISEQIKMNHDSFEDAVDNLANEVQEAQTALSKNGTNILNETAQYFIRVTTELINSYVDRVSDHVKKEIGQCGPLSLSINGALTATCEKVLLPWNGFWFSLFWTIVLYVITIIVAVKLANLYQKHKPYDQYIETEYLYDAYADRGDNIPLNSRGGKRKKKGKKSKRYEERPASGRDYPRDYAAGSHPPDGRYADMAPNVGNPIRGQYPHGEHLKSTRHWEDFPNGGPPRYQRAPTEYERPPPYYYPGSAGDH